MKHGVDLSDLDTTAVIMPASTPCNRRVECTRVIGKHRASEDANLFKRACWQYLLCWSLFADPKPFLNALVPCGHAYCWCAPVAAVLERHGQSNVLYFVAFEACMPWLSRGVD